LPQVRNIEVEREMLMVSNKSLAEFNLSREPRLRQARQRLIESYQKASEDFREVESKKQTLDELSRQVSLDTTLAILQTSAAQTEEETESIAEKFLDGSIDVEAFLEDFLPKRKLAHLRRIKVDKLSELIYRTQHQQNSQNWTPIPVASGGGVNPIYVSQPPVMPPAYPPYGTTNTAAGMMN